MKIIHTADIHLDSPILGVKEPTARRLELLRALKRLSDYADNHGVSAIIVAGDLFDDKRVSAQTVRSVADIVGASKAEWFVLKGNHGDASPYVKLRELCPQVRLFGNDWTQYDLGDVVIVGRELGVADKEHWTGFCLDKSKYNVLVLHGDVDSDGYGFIDRKAIASANVDYVALGHRHSFATHKFGNVKCCYSGVLEPRGFDETDKTGFVEIDTDTGKITFVPQAIRRVETVTLDISGIVGEIELEGKLSDAVSRVNTENYLNLILTGVAEQGVRVTFVAEQLLKDRFFALRIKDETETDFNLDAVKEEVSLRSEFVKLALSIPDGDKRQAVLKLGMALLGGEDIV